MEHTTKVKQQTKWLSLIIRIPVTYVIALIKFIAIFPYMIIYWCNNYKEDTFK